MQINWTFPKVFYGWWIVGASFLIGIYTSGILVYGFTAILEPVTSEFGWTRAQISFAASLRGLEEGFLVPLIGTFVDRWGPRRFAFSSAIVVALGYVFLSHASSLATFYGAYFIIGLGISGVGSTVLVTAVVNWFRSKAGIASAVALSGYMVGGLLAPLIVRVVDNYGWREATTIFAIGMLAIVLPLSLIFRHRPETYGYYIDGVEENALTSNQVLAEPGTVEANSTLKQAITGRAFWHMILAFICLFTVITGLLTHILPYLTSIGIKRSTAGFLVTLVSVSGIVGRLALGFTADKLDKRLVAAVPFAMMTVGMLCLRYATTAGTGLVIIGLILFGISWGGQAPLRAALVRGLFGRKRFGTILGLLTGICMIGAIAGPPLAGWVFDRWHSYQGAWFAFAAFALLGLIAMLTIPRGSTTALTMDRA